MNRVPRRRILASGCIDPEDFTDALREFEETLGALGSGNLNAGSWGTLDPSDDTEYETGALANTTASDSWTENRLAAAYTDNVATAFGQANCDVLDNARSWQQIPETLSTFSCDSGRLRLSLSVQLTQFSAQTTTGNNDAQPISVKLGVFMDGSLIVDSVIGGLDLSSEPANMEQGIGYFTFSQPLEVTVPVQSGRHTVYGVLWVEPLEGKNLSDNNAIASAYVHYATLTAHLRAR